MARGTPTPIDAPRRRPVRATAPCGSVLEGVLDLLAGLLDVGLGLVALALGLHLAVAGGPAGGFLALAGQVLGLVLDLVVKTHDSHLFRLMVPGASRGFRRTCHPPTGKPTPFRVALSP